MNSRFMLFVVALIATVFVLNTSTLAALVANQAQAAAQLRQEPITTEAGSRSEAAISPATGGASTSSASSVVTAARQSILTRGTTLLAELSGSLNAKKLKPGDKIRATLAQDLVINGKLVAKAESKLVGHVTEVRAHSADYPESRLGIVFDKLLLKHHQELEFEGVVQALAPPAPRVSRVDMPDQMMPPPTMSVASVSGSSGGRNSNSSTNASRSASTTTQLATTGGLGQVAVVGSTPGMTPGSASGKSKLAMSDDRNKPLSGGTGIHGIFGLKNLNLSPSADNSNPGPVIVSTKSDVKLESGTQVVLLVLGQ